MKKLLSLVLAICVLLVSQGIFADNSSDIKEYELPLKVMHISGKDGKESMASEGFKSTCRAIERNGRVTYFMYLKPIDFMELNGGVTNLFIYNNGSSGAKVEALKLADLKSSNDEYKTVFSFSRDSRENKLTFACWVDAMDKISGGNPGDGEQKAVLKFDWGRAKKVSSKMQSNAKITILVNGTEVFADSAPFINEANRMMVPTRVISESLGLKVKWVSNDKPIKIGSGANEVSLTIGSSTIKKSDGSEVKIDTAACLKNGRTMVPLRAIAELTGSKVDWDAKTSSALIWSK